MTLPISIIIPLYKNLKIFLNNLKKNKKFFLGCELIIVNDDPEEKVTTPIKKIFPKAKIIENKKNLGFAGSINKGVKSSNSEYIFLLNSDVVLKNDKFKKSLDYFKKNKKLFAVTFAQIEKNRKIVGANSGYFKDGLIHHSRRANFNRSLLSNNFWAEGGASIFRRDLFIKFGMMDELYSPFYWEDIDLSYRAWKSGYQIKFDPTIVVDHHHETTIGKYFDKEKIQKIAFRNQLIFNWKNLTEKKLIIEHLLNLPRYVFTPGFFEALKKMPLILKERKKVVRLFKKQDSEVLRLSNS